MNSLWLILTAAAAFCVAYRFYGAFLAAKVVSLNDSRITPAHRLHDGVDYHPTNRLVLFGVHFAAIAGPGPLIGPVLAAQWGFAPGFAWIVIGACLAGAVHDFVVMTASVRNDGLSLPKLASRMIGPTSGVITSVATLLIIVATLASVAVVVVNALAESSWGMFTILVTIPAALITGLWMYKIRPGRVGEASVIGVTIVMAGVLLGKPFAESAWGASLLMHKQTLALILPTYAFFASVLPVWLLMCPRDYLSSYMKIGVMIVLGAGIVFAAPELKMPATTTFIHGGGPVVSGALWPFLCITIMCGAISGFHALIASGTTPKMIDRERDIRAIGYGGMVLEGFVAITALVAACALEPGDYFAINVAQDTPAQVQKYDALVASHGESFPKGLAAVELTQLEEGTKEKLRGRVGGAVTLAVGMSKIFSSIPMLSHLMDYWYHFVIMFEALFILTLLETGTRVARFVFQETLTGWAAVKAGVESPLNGAAARKPNWTINILMSAAVCFAWGYLLYRGDLNTLWRMLGIANQLLATIALAVGTTYLLLHGGKRGYALMTAIPFFFVLVTVLVAGVMSIQGWWAAADAAEKASDAFMGRLMCVLAGSMLFLTGIIALDAMRRWIQILRGPADTAGEVAMVGK